MPHPGKDKELKARIRSELERGVDPKEIADNSNIPSTTVRRWLKNLKLYGQMNTPPQGAHKSVSAEMQTYLLGYLHGKPDAQLAEMRHILIEVFNQDVSLPTLSRTLKSRGCMKGHRKSRDFHPTLYQGKENATSAASSPPIPGAVSERGHPVPVEDPDGILQPPGQTPQTPKTKTQNINGGVPQPTSAENTAEPYKSPYQENTDVEHSSSVYDQLQDYMKQV